MVEGLLMHTEGKLSDLFASKHTEGITLHVQRQPLTASLVQDHPTRLFRTLLL